MSVPQDAVDRAASAMEQGIERAAVVLNRMAEQRPNITPAIARLLGLSDVPQTRRMAGAAPNRALLDRRVICDLLGCDADTYAAARRLCAKWCAEPSVHGGKRRPRGAALVV